MFKRSFFNLKLEPSLKGKKTEGKLKCSSFASLESTPTCIHLTSELWILSLSNAKKIWSLRLSTSCRTMEEFIRHHISVKLSEIYLQVVKLEKCSAVKLRRMNTFLRLCFVYSWSGREGWVWRQHCYIFYVCFPSPYSNF